MKTKAKRVCGFAALTPERQRELASMGGKAVKSENRKLAAEAGRIGGTSVPADKRSFSQSAELAATAGRMGGAAPHQSRKAAQ